MKYLCNDCLQVYTEDYSSIENMWSDHTAAKIGIKSECEYNKKH